MLRVLCTSCRLEFVCSTGRMIHGPILFKRTSVACGKPFNPHRPTEPFYATRESESTFLFLLGWNWLLRNLKKLNEVVWETFSRGEKLGAFPFICQREGRSGRPTAHSVEFAVQTLGFTHRVTVVACGFLLPSVEMLLLLNKWLLPTPPPLLEAWWWRRWWKLHERNPIVAQPRPSRRIEIIHHHTDPNLIASYFIQRHGCRIGEQGRCWEPFISLSQPRSAMVIIITRPSLEKSELFFFFFFHPLVIRRASSFSCRLFSTNLITSCASGRLKRWFDPCVHLRHLAAKQKK